MIDVHIYPMTTSELHVMKIEDFKNIVEKYDRIDLVRSSYSFHTYMIKEQEDIHDFKEKINLLISKYKEKNEQSLKNLLDSACFWLDVETVESILQIGCKVDEKIYETEYGVPLFRTFLYNFRFVDYEGLDVSEEKRMRIIGKLLIQNGALLEANIKRYRSETFHFIEIARAIEQEKNIMYIKEYEDLFNEKQRKQWGKMRLYTIV